MSQASVVHYGPFGANELIAYMVAAFGYRNAWVMDIYRPVAGQLKNRQFRPHEIRTAISQRIQRYERPNNPHVTEQMRSASDKGLPKPNLDEGFDNLCQLLSGANPLSSFPTPIT